MQNNYVGDVGDFLKYGLLNEVIKQTTYKLGVNWYLAKENSRKKKQNDDGKYTTYLENSNKHFKSLRQCNAKLHDQLKKIVFTEKGTPRKNKSIKEIADHNILLNRAVFFSEPVNDSTGRIKWHQTGLRKLVRAEIVFLDPDNGLETEHMASANKNSQKHVTFTELADYYERCQSVIVYNHKSHQKESIYQKRFSRLNDLDKATILILRGHRGTARDFVFIIRPEHKTSIENAMSGLMESKWNEHFSSIQKLF